VLFKYTVTPSTGVPITWKNEPGILVGRGEVRRDANVCYFGYPRGHRTRLSKRCTHEESKASSTTGDGLCHPLSYLVTLFGAHCSPTSGGSLCCMLFLFSLPNDDSCGGTSGWQVLQTVATCS